MNKQHCLVFNQQTSGSVLLPAAVLLYIGQLHIGRQVAKRQGITMTSDQIITNGGNNGYFCTAYCAEIEH
jgi:hypothetical protein